MPNYDQFENEARGLVVAAQAEARDAGAQAVSAAHLVCAAAAPGSALLAAFDAAGVNATAVRVALRGLFGGTGAGAGHLALDNGAKNALTVAGDIATMMGSVGISAGMVLSAAVMEVCDDGQANVFGGEDLAAELALAAQQQQNGEEARLRAAPVAGGTPVPAGEEAPLDKWGRNLNAEARAGKIGAAIGRADETAAVVFALARKTKNNPVLIGEAGVGKTAIVEGLAVAIDNAEVPAGLAGYDIYEVAMSVLVAGTTYRGDFEQRLVDLIDDVTSRNQPDSGQRPVIVFFDELHTIVGAGAASSGSMDASNILKPMLARGEFRVIGATTLDEYREHIEKDPALARRFNPVLVEEPTHGVAVDIATAVAVGYAAHHKVAYTADAVEAAVRLSARYISDRQLPDKALDLLDTAGAKHSVLRANDDVEGGETVDADQIAGIVSAMTGIPVGSMGADDKVRLRSLAEDLSARVIGQPDAVSAVSRAIRRARAGVANAQRPIGSFIFAGPTGVGKTETAKALAQVLFGTSDALITVDMGEYSQGHNVSKLLGAPPGYVGYDQGGDLTEQVRRKPFSVVLFDEVEKAHPVVFDTLLQVLEEGRMTDGHGRRVDFTNTVIILTSNLGARAVAEEKVALGFGGEDHTAAKHQALVSKALGEFFRPEFLNRIDEVVQFSALSQQSLTSIVDLMVGALNERLATAGIAVSLTGEAKEYLAAVGYDPTLGARPLRRALTRHIEDRISEMMLFDEVEAGQTVTVDAVAGAGFSFTAS